ncbi:hypothetical protein BH11PLA1_BH11PLA1_13800 [soil metagenome]
MKICPSALASLASLALLAAALAGCHGANMSAEPRYVAEATPAQRAGALDRVKALAGSWDVMDGNKSEGTITFTTTAGGSAVREVMFPGSPHEMTNMYTMDGSDLVMTHYCASGNQPCMRAKSSTGSSLPFAFDSARDLNSAAESCMGEMTLEWQSDGRVVEHWSGWEHGASGPKTIKHDMVLVRRK